LALAAALALLLPSPAARAQETCAMAYESAQELRRGHELSRSRTELRLCERSCPKKLAEDCTAWLRDVEAELATVLLDVRDADGQPLARVHVTADGAPLVDAIPTEPVEIDPGTHTLVFEDETGARAQAVVTLAPGERGRGVSVRFPRPVAAPLPVVPLPPAPVAVHHSPAAFVLGGLGLAGLAAGAILGIKGLVDRSNLAATCAPGCNLMTQVDPIAREWWGGAGAAIAGGVLLGSGIVVWVVEERSGKAKAPVLPVARARWVGVLGRF